MTKASALSAWRVLMDIAEGMRFNEIVTTSAHISETGLRMVNRLDELKKFIENTPEPNDITQRLERIENYLEQGFLAANFQHTENVGKVCASKLVKYPKDINAMSLVTKLDNDQRIIEPAMRVTNCALWRHIVEKYGNGATLKYFEMEPPKQNQSTETKMIITQ